MSYTQKLPARDRTAPYDITTLAADLLTEAKVNLASNNIVVPVLQCFNLLLENDVFEEAVGDIVCLSRFVVRSLLQPARRGAAYLHNSGWLIAVTSQFGDVDAHRI